MASALQVDSTSNTMTEDLEASTICEITQSLSPGASLPTRAQLARLLSVVGSATMVMGMTTAFYRPPTGPVFGRFNPAVYYFILVVILAAAAVEMATAFVLLRFDGPRSHAFAKRLQPFAYLLLLVAVSAGGFAIPFSKV